MQFQLFSNISLGTERYVIEGDSERSIDPIAPDLKTVEDLKNYSHIFTDEDDIGSLKGIVSKVHVLTSIL